MSFTDVVSVVGGGWSFREVDHSKVPGKVIAVNEAGLLLETQITCIVTMDRLWTENRWAQLCELEIPFYARPNALKNVDWKFREWVRVYQNDYKSVTFSDDLATLNGTNSGAVALNRAYQMRPKQLFLFGFDMCRDENGNPYWYPPYPWAPLGATKPSRYNEWVHEFNEIALQFAEIGTRVINVSAHSKLRCFERYTPKQLGMER